jgi:hypothetical protein
MDLLDARTGTILAGNPQEQEWGNRLIELFKEMTAAGHPPHHVAFYFCEIAMAVRCEESLRLKFKVPNMLKPVPKYP